MPHPGGQVGYPQAVRVLRLDRACLFRGKLVLIQQMTCSQQRFREMESEFYDSI